LRADSDRASQLVEEEERVASLEKKKDALEDAFDIACAEAKNNAEAAEAARAAEEANAHAEKAKMEAEEAQKLAEDMSARGNETIQ
jgi:hypothetical protein